MIRLASVAVLAALAAAAPPRASAQERRPVGLTATLSSLGLRPGDVERAAALVTSSAYANPRPATADDVRAILTAALSTAPARS